MALDAQPPGINRRRWLWAGITATSLRAWGAAGLSATWDGDNLHVAAPQLHFLAGKPLERLKDGLSVVFVSQLTLFADSRNAIFRRTPDRLVVSYDLWEERFSVTRLGGAPQTRSHLTTAAAEAWAVESLWISAAGLTPTRTFWLRLEIRPVDPKETQSVVGEGGISLTRLVEIFSRRPGAADLVWSLEAGPLRLADLKRVPGRTSG